MRRGGSTVLPCARTSILWRGAGWWWNSGCVVFRRTLSTVTFLRAHRVPPTTTRPPATMPASAPGEMPPPSVLVVRLLRWFVGTVLEVAAGRVVVEALGSDAVN